MNLWKDKKILITGHTGFKGSWLSLVLKSFDAKLYGLSKSSKAGIYEDLNLSNIFEEEEFLDIYKNPEKLEMFLQRINPEIVSLSRTKSSTLYLSQSKRNMKQILSAPTTCYKSQIRLRV